MSVLAHRKVTNRKTARRLLEGVMLGGRETGDVVDRYLRTLRALIGKVSNEDNEGVDGTVVRGTFWRRVGENVKARRPDSHEAVVNPMTIWNLDLLVRSGLDVVSLRANWVGGWW